MKQIATKIFSAVFGLTLLTACDLETSPTTSMDSDAVFSNTEDAEKVLNGAWRYLMETWYTYANPGYGAILRASDAMGSDVVLNTKYGFSTHYAFSAVYGKGGTNTLSWLLAYRTINDCNGVIANIDKVTGTESDRNRIKGQALALRGFMYLHLASLYSFAIDKDPDAVCAPIYTEATDVATAKEGKPASSVSEVYAQALNDLEEAYTLIPDNYSRSSKHKIDRQVVLGLLSRTALYSRNWQKAAEYSDRLLSINDYLMSEEEFKSGFNNAENNEWIWGHPQTNDQCDPSYQFYYLDTTTEGSYYYSFNVDPYFRDKYDDGDYRKSLIYWAVDPGSDPESAGLVWMRNAKFKFRDIQNMVADIVLMRVAEIYLINAEAKARIGTGGAVESLNKVRSARGAQLASETLSGQELLEEIWLERRRELWGEGFSLVDNIRNQRSVERKEWPSTKDDYVAITYTKNGETKTDSIMPQGHRILKFPDGSDFCANSKYYLFRITDAEELANKHLYDNHPRLAIYD